MDYKVQSVGEVSHILPFREKIEGSTERQIWDNIGVLTRGPNPVKIKENYIDGRLNAEHASIVYQASEHGIDTAHIGLPDSRIINVSLTGISIVGEESRKFPTQADISEALANVRGYGEISYHFSKLGYVQDKKTGSHKVRGVTEEVSVTRQIAGLLDQYLEPKRQSA
jgi:hypothetical protein